jgi:hypothetical protein
MGVYVYIDGFNFYYRLFKNRARRHQLPKNYKWLDLLKLSQTLLPGQPIDWIGYFTAYIRPSPNDPDQPVRQRAYIEAIKTIPCLEVIAGQFLEVEKSGVPIGAPPNHIVRFKTFEEKGSDVNLACRLVLDGARGSFSEALVITNDGDLQEPIRVVTQDLRLPVRVISPDLTVNGTIRKVATSAAPLDVKLLKRCLFPAQLVNADGVPISKPAAWS